MRETRSSGSTDRLIRLFSTSRGNAARSNFAVWGYDDDGETTQLFVNAIDPYEGIRPLGMQEEGTTRLQVEAKGGWLIEVRPIDSARVAPVGDIVKGAGDDVLRVEGEADTAIIEGNAAQSNFAVWAYGGFFPDLLLNEIEQYSGETMVPPGTEYLVVEAKGPWAISLRE
ncbi:MAG: hypothetical protein M5U22_08545 [Thermoleophilia bacterium]|nr:hypothetical protein [Thermoleophilia bacterium]